MSLSIEWMRRIDNWRRELPNHFYRPLGSVEFAGFVTTEQLAAAEALSRDFSPMPKGTRWGGKWEYGWFRGAVVVPAEAMGKRIVLQLDLGGESTIYIDGQLAGAQDRQHREITLAMSGHPGHKCDVLVESYAGHGPRVHYAGPTPPGRLTVPEPESMQTVVGASTFGIWDEDAYHLWVDVEALYHLRNNLDPNSLRVMEIDEGLRDFTLVVDYELPLAARLATMRDCRERLRPLLACVNGSTAPTMYMFGHAHIDVAWLWPLAETERKCARTFATQLALMAEYPEYKFLQSQPHLYTMTRKRYPELYQRIIAASQGGQWIADGGMWVEADTNISSGESLIRQFLHGKRFFHEQFDVDCTLLWLPDVFGYSGALPQIMRGCGIKYFATAKIFWNYNGGDPFPYNTFTWEGIDGSEVLVHLCNDYNSQTDPGAVVKRWNERVQKDGFSTRLFPFGWGDGGGGPTRDHLEYIRRLRDLEGAPRCRLAAPAEYFRDEEETGRARPRYVGELYFQAHRGTYTSQARTKRGNRKGEIALREAEMWGTIARALKGFPYSVEEMDAAWKMILLNQFHDIIPGSSIHRVYEEAEAAYGDTAESAEQVQSAAQAALVGRSRAVTVFNSLSWQRAALVALPAGFAGVADLDGQPLPVQVTEGKAYAQATAPSCGWTTLLAIDFRATIPAGSNLLRATPTLLENQVLRLEFNARGEIVSIYDKESRREIAAGVCNSLRMYRDVPTSWDAWDIDSMVSLTPVALDSPALIEVVATGPLFARLRVTRKLNESMMVQEITLECASRRVDFHTVIDWQESHKLLKVAFAVDMHTNEAVHEIQFGHIRRPNHMSRPFDADRFEVSNHKWSALVEENRGFAVLNDCKYGLNVLGNTVNLTLLKSPLAPDMTGDKGRQEFTYSLLAWNGPFAECPVVRGAYELNCPVTLAAGAGGQCSTFSLDAANVIIDTVKPAEDGSRDIIVRLYEAKRAATRCKLTATLPVLGAARTSMLEVVEAELPVAEGKVTLEFRPFEIVTVRLRLGCV